LSKNLKERAAAAEKAKQARLAALEDQVTEICQTANSAYDKLRDELNERGQVVNPVETENNALSLQIPREVDR
jgi:F0F1-type ATP synthase membrane subunit b/b'